MARSLAPVGPLLTCDVAHFGVGGVGQSFFQFRLQDHVLFFDDFFLLNFWDERLPCRERERRKRVRNGREKEDAKKLKSGVVQWGTQPPL